jgi:hypothetical protein
MVDAGIFDRAKLLAGNLVQGPAIITEMDSTTLVLPDCAAEIHETGVILIRPRTDAPAASLTQQQQQQPQAVDTVTLDIVENALRSIRFEMDAVLYRTAMSPGIREQHDQFPMIANPGGQMVVGQFGSFIHGLRKSYTKPIDDGDIILLSDPYSCDGAMSHANDWLVVMPIFVPGTDRMVRTNSHAHRSCLSSMVTHQPGP